MTEQEFRAEIAKEREREVLAYCVRWALVALPPNVRLAHFTISLSYDDGGTGELSGKLFPKSQ